MKHPIALIANALGPPPEDIIARRTSRACWLPRFAAP